MRSRIWLRCTHLWAACLSTFYKQRACVSKHWNLQQTSLTYVPPQVSRTYACVKDRLNKCGLTAKKEKVALGFLVISCLDSTNDKSALMVDDNNKKHT